jgi:hypothetical protein
MKLFDASNFFCEHVKVFGLYAENILCWDYFLHRPQNITGPHCINVVAPMTPPQRHWPTVLFGSKMLAPYGTPVWADE